MNNAFKRFPLSQPPIIWLGIFVFGYSLIVSTCLQLLVIPRLFSQPGAADGLIVLDSIGFDQLARAKATEIAKFGWSAWELRPQWRSPAGIASAFYAFWNSSPSSMLPFNAVVHAISSCTVFAILRSFYSTRPALLGAVVFALNPASLEWVAQIHRDGIFILGNLLYILALVRIFRLLQIADRRYSYRVLGVVSISIAGTALVWVARPYWVQVMLVTTVLAIVQMLVTVLSFRRYGGRRLVHCVTVIVCIFAVQLWVARYGAPDEQMYQGPIAGIAGGAGVKLDGCSGNTAIWRSLEWLPAAVDERFFRIVAARNGAISQGGASLIDADRCLNSVGAILVYLPRAVQLGLFSPFPDLWSGQGSTPAMTMARKIMGVVTAVFYVCLLGLAVGLVRMRKVPELWTMLEACLVGILLFSLTYPNVGTLMRYRYGFYMLLVGFGVSFWCDLWMRRIRQ